MRIWATDKGTEIQLDASERRTLRKAASVMATLAKHYGGEAEAKASQAAKEMADKWGKDTTNAN